MSNKVFDTKRFRHTASSLRFCSHALVELSIIMPPFSSDDVSKVVYRAPFNFYRVSLTYVVILEYCKLLEKKRVTERSPQLSSLFHLIDEALANIPRQKQSIFIQHLKDLGDL